MFKNFLVTDEVMEVVELAFREEDLGHVEVCEDYRGVKNHVGDSKF